MAEEVGKEIAKAGAKKRGGLTVGILPGFEKEEANE
ncbi:MAG: TIGR00725 family protein, partial [Euryarchaeota archaeon]|nr:TIGR00725 family protein [Euryarchaeota archaeon]